MTAIEPPQADLDQVAAAGEDAVVVDVREPGQYIEATSREPC